MTKQTNIFILDVCTNCFVCANPPLTIIEENPKLDWGSNLLKGSFMCVVNLVVAFDIQTLHELQAFSALVHCSYTIPITNWVSVVVFYSGFHSSHKSRLNLNTLVTTQFIFLKLPCSPHVVESSCVITIFFDPLKHLIAIFKK
jgi:hypothetical protein